MMNQDAVIEVKELHKHFPIQRGFLRRVVGQVKAVDDVSFAVRRGETLALVGESGCGKTTTGRCILRAIEPSAGQILFRPNGNESTIDLTALAIPELRQMQRHMGMIFQDPYSSLNPRLTILEIIGEPFVNRRLVTRKRELEERVAELLQSVRLDPSYMRRYPHAFSGGQRQRIAIARALALNPPFVVADEPVSALDVSIQAQTLNLLQDLQEQFNLAYLFVSHDLSVVEHISDRVAVMYVGKMVEMADTEELFHNPKHPYTEALLSSVPKPETKAHKDRIILSGEVPSPSKPPSGCYFHPRCRYATALCTQQEPPLMEISPGHVVACHFADTLTLRGVTA